MPLARRCTFQLRTLSLFWEVRGGAGGTTTARSGYPSSPRPGPLRSTSRRDRHAAAISRGRPDHPGGPASLAPRRVPTSMPAPRRRAAFRPRRAQAPVWRSEVPERARARSLPCAAPRSLPRTRASTPRRLSAAPRAGTGVAQRGAGASPCSLLALCCAPSGLGLPCAALRS